MVAKHENVKWVDVSDSLFLPQHRVCGWIGMVAVVPLKPHAAQPRRLDDVVLVSPPTIQASSYIPHCASIYPFSRAQLTFMLTGPPRSSLRLRRRHPYRASLRSRNLQPQHRRPSQARKCRKDSISSSLSMADHKSLLPRPHRHRRLRPRNGVRLRPQAHPTMQVQQSRRRLNVCRKIRIPSHSPSVFADDACHVSDLVYDEYAFLSSRAELRVRLVGHYGAESG